MPFKRATSSKLTPSLELSIRGDELEKNRIQLEQNLQNTDLSLHLSSVPDENLNSNSVEYPRHHPGPTPFATDFADNSRLHNWSYRSGDDDEGINPYAAETMSTQGHHASALTLNAGLGDRGSRRDISISGAEYDPERPIQDIIAGVDSRISLYGLESSRPKYPEASAIGFDPMVAHHSAELDRVLQSGLSGVSLSRSVRLRSPSPSETDSDFSQPAVRPRITDSLRHVSFSPRRPRSASSPRPSHHPLPSRETFSDSNLPTPKPRLKRNINPSPAPSNRPEVRLQPPTPSTASSKFSKLAKGITKEIETERLRSERDFDSPARARKPISEPGAVPPEGRTRPKSPSRDNAVNNAALGADVTRQSVAGRRSFRQTPRGKSVHLPDVTGLTAAVESPARNGLRYFAYPTNAVARETEAYVLSTLSNVQTKLAHLESENGISRRRVQELEYELELCRKDVARERTRILDQEELTARLQPPQTKGVSRSDPSASLRASVNGDTSSGPERYKEVVEEKKALEALINSLRSHLTRLTKELSDHKQLLGELRELRDSDSQAIKEKSQDVDSLREQVERLAGEVEVLRGVVEEGLKERRMAREDLVRATMNDEEENNDDEERAVENNGEWGAGRDVLEESEEEKSREEPHTIELESDEEVEDAPARGPHSNGYSPAASPRTTTTAPPPPDRTMHTDFATAGSASASGMVTAPLGEKTMHTDHATVGSFERAGATPKRYVDEEEMARIVNEVEDRRSERSASMASGSNQLFNPSASRASSRSGSPPLPNVSEERSGLYNGRNRPGIRPSAPTPRIASRPNRRSSHEEALNDDGDEADVETPFPRIRGNLEKLFFSAPEHNVKTCPVCHRRGQHGDAREEPRGSWLPSQRERAYRGLDVRKQDTAPEKGKERHYVEVPESLGQELGFDAVPSQTVLMKVIRELEDDFTHYKGIYVELAEQYAVMGPVNNVPKRNILAKHLHEVVDILEHKGDQIAALTNVLQLKP